MFLEWVEWYFIYKFYNKIHVGFNFKYLIEVANMLTTVQNKYKKLFFNCTIRKLRHT